MTAEDPILLAAREVLASALTAIRECVESAPMDALDWQPGGDDTSTIAILAVHSLASTRSWLARATGAPRPHRNRDDEFAVAGVDAAALLVTFDEIARDCTALLRSRCRLTGTPSCPMSSVFRMACSCVHQRCRLNVVRQRRYSRDGH